MTLTDDQKKVARAANGILWLWRECITEDPWHKHEARQAYRDAMNLLCRQGLIQDFDLETLQVRVSGVWTAARTTIRM